MKSRSVVYNRGPWCVISFPERNRAIVFNTITKEYEFRSCSIDEKPKVKKQLPKINLIELKDDWKRIAMWTAGGFVIWGIAITGLILYKII
jgi:hypothetical protein